MHVGERPLHRPDHLGDRHLGGVPGQPVAAVGAALAADDAGSTELREDALQEAHRDPWAVAIASPFIGTRAPCTLAWAASSAPARTA